MGAKTFRGGEYLGVRIPTIFDENDAIRCDGCGGLITEVPFRISIMDFVAAEVPPTWARGAPINPGPHEFHVDPGCLRGWAKRKAYYLCRLSDVREIMRPVPVPGEPPRMGVCDGMHREAHELVPA